MYYKPDHIAIKVDSMKDSEKFYQEAFGFSVCAERYYEESGVHTVFLKALHDDMQIQLIQFPQSTGLQTGFGHFSVCVEDAAEAYAVHSSKNYRVGPLMDLGYQKCYFIKDPDGYETEVIQPYHTEDEKNDRRY